MRPLPIRPLTDPAQRATELRAGRVRSWLARRLSAIPPSRTPSLAGRLLRPLLLLWLAMGAFTLVAVVDLVGTAVERSFDRRLQDTASALAAQVRWGPAGAELTLLPQASDLIVLSDDDETRFSVLTNEGRVVAGVPGVPRPVNLSDSLVRPQFYDTRIDGQASRGVAVTVASPDLRSTATVLIVESVAKRRGVARDAGWRIGVPALVFGGISVLFIVLGVRRGLDPVTRLAQKLQQRSPTDLAPLPLAGVPAEVSPLLLRFNALMEAIRLTMEAQRRLVADAAHQLRTPVAGIQVLADDLMRSETSAQSRPVVEALARSAARMSRLTQQLLALARSESARLDEDVAFDVVAAVRDALQPLVREALDAGKTFALDAPPGTLLIRGHPLLLGEAVVNLVDNAIRYGGSSLRVGIAGFETAIVIQVEDDGPGIAAVDREQAFEPFWRGVGRAHVGDAGRADTRQHRGSGLGLAVARDVAHRHGGELVVASRPEFAGTRFQIRLPRLMA